MKTLRYLLAVAATMAVGAVASAQTNLVRNNSTNEVNVSFSIGDDAGRNNITWKTGSTGVFNAGSTLTVNGTFNGAPTGGTLDLSLVTLIGVSGGISDGDKGDITVGGSGTTLTVDDGAITLAKMASMATASLLGRNTGGTGAPEVLSAATARSLLGLGGAALLNIGTGSGTAAAGDDARITGAVQSTRTISTTSPLSGGGDMSANRTFSIADAAADGATKGAAAFTSGHFSASSGVISLANSGVTAGTHGNSTHTPVIQVDAQGRVISLSNTSTSGGGGIGGNYTVTGNVIASSGNVTINSATDTNIVLDPGGTGVTTITGAGNTTGNFTVGDSLAVTNNATFGNLTVTNNQTIGNLTITNLDVTGTITNASGTGNIVLTNSPTLVTPTLGVATVTSVNKVAITAPATGSTLTIADGKTLTASNSITIAGTDSTTMTFPSSSGSVVTKATNMKTFYLTIDDLADSMNYGLGFVEAAFTILEIRAVHTGTGLSSPSVSLTVNQGTDRTSGTAVVTGGSTITSSTTGTSITSFNDATCPANSWLWITTASKSGTTDNFEIVVRGTYDN